MRRGGHQNSFMTGFGLYPYPALFCLFRVTPTVNSVALGHTGGGAMRHRTNAHERFWRAQSGVHGRPGGGTPTKNKKRFRDSPASSV